MEDHNQLPLQGLFFTPSVLIFACFFWGGYYAFRAVFFSPFFFPCRKSARACLRSHQMNSLWSNSDWCVPPLFRCHPSRPPPPPLLSIYLSARAHLFPVLLKYSCFLWPFSPALILLRLTPLRPLPSSSPPSPRSPLLPDHVWFISFSLKNVLNELNRAKWHPLWAWSTLDPVDDNFCCFLCFL